MWGLWGLDMRFWKGVGYEANNGYRTSFHSLISLYNEGSFCWGIGHPEWVKLWLEEPGEKPKAARTAGGQTTPGKRRTRRGHPILSKSAGQGLSTTLKPTCMGQTDRSCHRGWRKIYVSWGTPEWCSTRRVWWDHCFAKTRTSTHFWAARKYLGYTQHSGYILKLFDLQRSRKTWPAVKGEEK